MISSCPNTVGLDGIVDKKEKKKTPSIDRMHFLLWSLLGQLPSRRRPHSSVRPRITCGSLGVCRVGRKPCGSVQPARLTVSLTGFPNLLLRAGRMQNQILTYSWSQAPSWKKLEVIRTFQHILQTYEILSSSVLNSGTAAPGALMRSSGASFCPK